MLWQSLVCVACREQSLFLCCARYSFYLLVEAYYFRLSFASIAPATLFPADALPYFFPALAAILAKFLPGFPISFPADARFAEYDLLIVRKLLVLFW